MPGVLVLLAALTSTWLSTPVGTSQGPDSKAAGLAVRITSPIGRTGISEKIRIVAQVVQSAGPAVESVRFLVDGKLLGEVRQGPPYAIEWIDENPFERNEIMVEARAGANTVNDTIVLEPLEITEVSDLTSVALDVSVQNQDGRFIKGLGKDDFTLTEDGMPQALDQVGAVQVPVVYTLLIDSSQSMARRSDDVRFAAVNFAKHLRPQDSIVIAPFTKSIGPITGPTQDHKTILEAIDAIRPVGGTAILDSLQQAAAKINAGEHRHVFVLMTDGYDEHSTIDREAALAAMKQLHAPLYVVGIAGSAGISLRGERFLRELAIATNGQAFFPSRDPQIERAHQRVVEEVAHRYFVSYTPANQARDGSWRTIRLESKDPSWRVRTRTGYFAPAPPPVRPSIEFTIEGADERALEVSAGDLKVSEDGVPQKLDVFQEAVTPVSIVLALDASGSMRNAADAAKSAAASFISSVRSRDKLALTLFADSVTPVHDFAQDASVSARALDKYIARGGTALYDALVDSMERLKKEQGRRVVVLVTDGRDENNAGTAAGSVHDRAAVMRLLQETDATIFAIGVGSKVDRELLESIAGASGGVSYFPSDVSELERPYSLITENLRRRYVISYTSTNTKRDGAWRQVQISTSAGGRVRSKGGYNAPEK